MSNPVVTAKNNTSRDLYVAGDPNWDDQQLMVNGNVITEPYTLTKGSTAMVSVGWEGPGEELMMGVIFSEAANYDGPGVGFYQLSVGQDPKTGNLAVTEGGPNGGTLHIQYTLSDQTPWTMKMDFTDAE
ncbi:MAG TPA: hypothetical protein VGS07_15050 [Thermoanaerobaculia bacterium]|jgi:hypothetical protein|nr:hypothetical protein [Thermoanaerobaculia bacterium]